MTIRGHALNPIPLKDGTYVLPEEVLSDPAHAQHFNFLNARTKRTVLASEYYTESEIEAGEHTEEDA